jgi:hypothetical protein
MALSETVFSDSKNGTVAPTPSSLMARLGMTVCFVAASGLLISGLVRSMPHADAGIGPKPVMAMTADNRNPGLK